MPNAHFHVAPVQRSHGQSAVARAAYISGQALHDERIGKRFDYSRKRGEDLQFSAILAPEDAPAWATDRGQLWNQVEACEKRQRARVGRSMTAALPRELTREQQIALIEDFSREQFISKGMIADINLHESIASDGLPQPHVHILVTERQIGANGFSKTKHREWDSKAQLIAWREAWEEVTNRHLADAGSEDRVSLASYERQGIDKEPQTHIGYQANGLERDGIETMRGNHNREIKANNGLVEIAASYLEPEEVQWDDSETAGERSGDADRVSLFSTRDDAALSNYLTAGLHRTWRASAEMITRTREFFAESWEAATTVFDRFTTWTERARDKERDREKSYSQEHER